MYKTFFGEFKIGLVIISLIIGTFIGIAFATTFSSTYDTATPAGSDDPAEADDRMREIKAAIQERENVDHYWPLTGTEVSNTDAGEHRKVLFHAPISTPSAIAANHGQLYLKDVSSIAELHFMDESENEIQLTSGGVSALGHILTAKATSDTLTIANMTGNQTFTNTGASAVVTLTLPAGAVNYKVLFIVTDTDGLRIDPDGTENFVDFTQSSSGGKYISSSTVGSSITIAWNNAASGEWQITEIIGIWDIES